MKRKDFLERMGMLAGAGFLTAFLPAPYGISGDEKIIKGTVRSAGKGLAKVVVSDGYTVVVTDSRGNFTMTTNPASRAIFVSTPSGYAFNHEKGIAKQYQFISELPESNELNFDLVPLDEDDTDHQFVIWADPQVKNADDVDKMMRESVPDVQKFVVAAGKGSLLHGITVGDIVWDNHALFQDYNKAVQKMGIPFFQCLGNHDMDYGNGGDETSDITFQEHYGPTYYSFNRGQVHYVVMDNVRYLGKDREYDGFIQQNQLDWLEQDLSHVSKDNLIVLCLHIPVHKGTKNKEDLYRILDDRRAHIMSGHTHYNVNDIHENIYEHNHGAVCGAWWTGPICEDGTPCGYGIYTVKGNELSWQYKATGKAHQDQMELHISDFSIEQKQVLANIWNADPSWKTECWVDGNMIGSMEQFDGYDPDAYAAFLGPKLPAKRSFAEPKMTAHLYKAYVSPKAKEVKIIATDRFGNVYSSTKKV